MDMRECSNCGKDIPANMDDAHDEEYNYQLYYCKLCKDCYGEYGSRPFFISSDEDDELHPLLNPIIDYFDNQNSLRDGVYGVKDKKIYHYYYGHGTEIIDLTEIDRMIKLGSMAKKRHTMPTQEEIDKTDKKWVSLDGNL